MSRLFLLLPFLFLCACSDDPAEVKTDTAARKPKPVKKGLPVKDGLVYGTQLMKGIKTPYEEATGRLGDSLLISTYKGRVELSDTLREHRRFLFDIRANFLMDKIFVAPRPGGRWFVCWQETDHLGVSSYFALYKTGATTPEYKIRLKGANPGMPVIDGDAAYVSNFGMVGRMDVNEGQFTWQRDSLFNQYKMSFHKFEPAFVCKDKVIFVDYPYPGRRDKRDTLVLHPETGETVK